MKGYPPRFQRLLLVTLAAVVVSGVLLAPTTLALRADTVLWWQLAGSTRVWIAALHALAAFAMLLLAGALWSIHMRAGWRRHRHRGSGGLLVAGFLLLTVTAVIVYYASHDAVLQLAALVHLAVGLLITPLVVWHWWHGVRARRASRGQERLPRRHRRHG